MNGINLHYLQTGGDKPAIVLLQGLMLNRACWTSLAYQLEKDDDVIMPDARVHRGSSAPDHGYQFEQLASDVITLIEELNLISSVILGQSMGGVTAAVVASRNPKKLKGPILADPTFLTPQRQLGVY